MSLSIHWIGQRPWVSGVYPCLGFMQKRYSVFVKGSQTFISTNVSLQSNVSLRFRGETFSSETQLMPYLPPEKLNK